MQNFTSEKVYQATLNYFNNDELAAKVWMDKYALKDEEGLFLELTPDDMHRRMASSFFSVENKYHNHHQLYDLKTLSDYGQSRKALTEESIYKLFKDFSYLIPQGSVMANLGANSFIGSLSNCVVLPAIYDSYGGILKTDEQLAQLCKRRCGVGIDISTLRPADAQVMNTARSSSGAVSFMERYSNTTREVAQNGRRGALMLTIDVNHPDILEFIKIKSDLTKVTGANISVKLTDDFMVAVIKGNDFELLWESQNDQKQIKRVVPAKEIWDEIINQAYSTAEPGVLFWDRQHKYSTSSIYPQFKNLTTNPCSEIAMQGGDSCRLMALNLLGFVEHPFTAKNSFNFEKFYEVTYESMRLMDDLVDLEIESIDAILNKIDKDGEPDDVKKTERELWELLRKNGLEGRRTGLGFTGLADAIAALGISYNSDAAMEKTDAIMRTKLMGEFDCSIDMAIERGAFKGYDAAIEWESDFIKMMDLDFPDLFERMEKYGRRNVSISTVAPTGSVSILTQTSSGIEPVYQLSYTRKRKVKTENSSTTKDAMGDFWESNEVYHHQLKNWKEVNQNSKIEESPYFGNTANEIDWNYRLKLQKVIQKYTTHSISSTINLAKETTKDVVSSIYIKAWQLGLKGITVYRDGSRDGVLVSSSKEKKEADKIVVKRPQILKADVVRFKNESEDWIAFVGLINENPREIFTGKVGDDLSIPIGVNKGEIVAEITNGVKKYHFNYRDDNNNQHSVKEISKAFNPEFWNYAKLISGVLAHSKIEDVITLVEELNLNDQHLNTWKNGVKRVLSRYVKTLEGGNKCVSCGELSIIFEEGCAKCTSCGYQICS